MFLCLRVFISDDTVISFGSFSHPVSNAVPVTTLAGNGGTGFLDGDAYQSQATPFGVALSTDGTVVLFTDNGNNRIRRIAAGVVSTLAGSGNAAFADGTGVQASFSNPTGIVLSPDRSFAVICDSANHRLRRLVLATGAVTTLAGSGGAASVDASGTQASLNLPHGLAMASDASFLVFAEVGGHRIRKYSMATAQVATLAGSGAASFADGPGSLASFSSPVGVAIDPTGAFVLIADNGNHRIRKLDLATRIVSTIAGNAAYGFADGAGSVSQFIGPFGIAISADSSFALIADSGTNRMRRISIASSFVSTVAGTGSASWADGAGGQAAFYAPTNVAIFGDGSYAIVADSANRRVRHVQLAAPCGLGAFCPAGASSPTLCAAGRYCNATGMTAASAQLVCPAGSYCEPASVLPTACVANTYCNATGASSASDQIACDAGAFCAAGSTAPSTCTAGYFCATTSFNKFGAVDRLGTNRDLSARCIHY